MQMWFSQYHTANVKLDVRIQEQLFSGQSDYQKIDVFKSYEFGKMVALDGEIVFSDTDEFIYDEIKSEVLADEMVLGETDGYVKEWNINKEAVTMGVKKL